MSRAAKSLVLVLPLAAAALLLAAPPLLAEETVREKVERLFPDLGSASDETRERAERELWRLGEPARRELERMSRDADPKTAITALRLLTSDRWERVRDGEERARPVGPDGRGDGVPPTLREWEADLERRLAEVRRRFDEMHRSLRDDLPDWPRGFEFGIEDGGAPRGASSGKVVVGDRSFAWSIDDEGRVKVTTKDGRDAEEATVEAESLDVLREEHPDLAKRLDEVSPQGGVRRWVFRVPERRWIPWPDERADEEAKPGAETPGAPPLLGIRWSPVPELLREHVDLPEGGVVVDEVLPDTLAARLGLRRHDVVLDVAGRRISDDADVRAAVESVRAGDAVTVTVVRKGARATLTATR